MPIRQAFNPKTKRWVKYHFVDGKPRIIQVKKQNPCEPFRNVPVKGRRNRRRR